MNQIGDKVVKISLIVLILLSLVLSWKIWTKPANRSLAEKGKDPSSELVQTKKMTEVYVPTKLFYHKEKDNLLYSNKETVINSLHNKLVALHYKSNEALGEKETREAFYALNSFNLLFPKELPVSVYESVYKADFKLPKELQEFNFNRIIYSFDTEKIYFVNASLKKSIAFDVKGDSKTLKDMVTNEKKNNYFPVTLEPENISGIYYMKDEIKLKTYSYIVATQSFTTFSKAFFDQSNDLYSNDSENVNLSNAEGESLTIQADNGEVNYFGKLKSQESDSKNSFYFDTFPYVENIGNTLGTLRYFDVKDGDITYRNYIEGFPVFGQNMKGRLEVIVQNRNVFVRTNQEMIQIPIPSSETVTLMTTEDLMAELVSAGVDTSLINDAQIGYEWQTNAETKQAADLVPTWYIHYDGAWYSHNELVGKIEKGGL
ncbi:MAG: two-component system activity regulator YycH [Vagococcus sp.]|uniref:YycH family regulatory protein n=1 Tax=Vagococcus sp. TaxID=1933889 RepID=UPI002FC8F0BD